MDYLTNKTAILIGSGYSLSEGIKKGLWDKLKDKFTIGLNTIYYDLIPTVLMYVDKNSFYEKHKSELKDLPLIIGREHKGLKTHPNTITIKHSSKYKRDCSKGIYKSSLSGLYSLSLTIYLLDVGTIYLLGVDYGCPEIVNNKPKRDKKNRPLTHYFQGEDRNHSGIGKCNYYYEKNKAIKDFGCYAKEEKVKIYNVSPISRIPEEIFPKISYNEFFNRIKEKNYNQDKLRKAIKEKVTKLKSIITNS